MAQRIAAAKCGMVKPLLELPAQRAITARMAAALVPFGFDLQELEVEMTICPERAEGEGARFAARLAAVPRGDTAARRQILQDAAGYVRAIRTMVDTFSTASPLETPPTGGPYLGAEPAGVSADPPREVRELYALANAQALAGDNAGAELAAQSAAALYTRWADRRVGELLAEMARSADAGIVDQTRAKEIIKIRRERHLALLSEDTGDLVHAQVAEHLMRGLNQQAAGYACLPTSTQVRDAIRVLHEAIVAGLTSGESGSLPELVAKYQHVAEALNAYLWEEGSGNTARARDARSTMELFLGPQAPGAFDSENDPCPWSGTATISIVTRSDTTIPGPRGNTRNHSLDSLTWDVTFHNGVGRGVARGKFEDISTMIVANTCFGRPPQPSMSVRDETRNEGAPQGEGEVKLRRVVVQRVPDRAAGTLGDSVHLHLTLPPATVQSTYTKKTEITGGCPSTTEQPGTSLTQDRASWTPIVAGRLHPLDKDSPGRVSGRSTLTAPDGLGTVTMEWNLNRERKRRAPRPARSEEN